jgi:hypothetical protein
VRRAVLLVPVVTLALGACGGTERATPRPAAAATPDPLDDGPPNALLTCVATDTAVYADLRQDPETGDTLGVWLTFWRAGGSVDGTRIVYDGDRVDTTYFTRVQLGDADSIAIDVPTAPGSSDTSRFLGRASCGRVWGRQRERRDVPTRPVVYHRIAEHADQSDAGVP